MMFSILDRSPQCVAAHPQGALGEINYAGRNCAAVRGSAAVKQSSLNAKTEHEKPVLLEQHCTTMHDDAKA